MRETLNDQPELVPLPEVLGWIGLEEFPPVPVDSPTYRPHTALFYKAGTDDRRQPRLHALRIKTHVNNSLIIEDIRFTPKNSAVKDSDFGFHGEIIFPEGDAPVSLTLKSVFFQNAGEKNVTRLQNPPRAIVQSLFTAFKTAMETGRAVGTADNPVEIDVFSESVFADQPGDRVRVDADGETGSDVQPLVAKPRF